METLTVSGNSILVKKGVRRPIELAINELRLNFIVTNVNEKWFITAGKSDLLVIDFDNDDCREGVELLGQEFQKSKPRQLSDIFICLADYHENRVVVELKSFRKAGIDIFKLLAESRSIRMEKRQKWLDGNPSMVLKGRFNSATLNKHGYVLSARKSLRWEDVGQIQIDKQISLITTTSLLVIPEGVSGGMFSVRKYKYALRGIPNKMSQLYLAECTFWMNYAIGAVEKSIEENAMRELIRDGVVSGDKK